jgi:hypothetical protein
MYLIVGMLLEHLLMGILDMLMFLQLLGLALDFVAIGVLLGMVHKRVNLQYRCRGRLYIRILHRVVGLDGRLDGLRYQMSGLEREMSVFFWFFVFVFF